MPSSPLLAVATRGATLQERGKRRARETPVDLVGIIASVSTEVRSPSLLAAPGDNRAQMAGPEHRTRATFDDLSDGDLDAFRLAVQVLAHKAMVSGSPKATLFFESLESAVMAEQAGRRQRDARRPAALPRALSIATGTEDRQLVAEYLHLLAANERLSAKVRDLALALASQAGAAG